MGTLAGRDVEKGPASLLLAEVDVLQIIEQPVQQVHLALLNHLQTISNSRGG